MLILKVTPEVVVQVKKQILEMLPTLTWLFGHCRSYEQTRPYSTWLDLLHSWLDEDGNRSQADVQDRLHTKSTALWGEQMQEYYPFLATILSLPLPDAFSDRLKHLDDALTKHRSLRIPSTASIPKTPSKGAGWPTACPSDYLLADLLLPHKSVRWPVGWPSDSLLAGRIVPQKAVRRSGGRPLRTLKVAICRLAT